MKANDDMHICKNHETIMTYRGDACPWCAFKDEVVKKLVSEYKRGFTDGVKAADLEYAKKEEAIKAKFVPASPAEKVKDGK